MGKIGLDNSKLSDNFYAKGFHSKTPIFYQCVNMTLSNN